MNKNKKLVSFRLSEELLESLRERADEDGVTVTELVTRLLKQGLQTSDNDRIAILEAQIQELQQYRQVNFSGLSSVPVYHPRYFQPNAAPATCEIETKQQIENLVKAQVKDEIAELKAMVKQVLASQGTNKS